MTCQEKTIAACQTMFFGTIIFHGEKVSPSGYRKYVLRIKGGPEGNQQIFECEVRKRDISKYSKISVDEDVEVLCWVNGRLYKGNVYTNLSLVHAKVIQKEIPQDDRLSDEDDLSCFDEKSELEELALQ